MTFHVFESLHALSRTLIKSLHKLNFIYSRLWCFVVQSQSKIL